MRKEAFSNGEYYHICNRGVDKRDITSDRFDSDRFIQSIIAFNSTDPIGSIYEQSFLERNVGKAKPLVNIVAYCLNPNHFHFLLEQVVEKGISRFMGKVCGGYASYFNEKYKRAGALLQGKYKARHITNNDDLLHASAYVNLNDKVHQLGVPDPKLIRNSWNEYIGPENKDLCHKSIILNQFTDKKEYVSFALESLELMLERKKEQKEAKSFEFGDI